jgi:hypothetical protein
MEEHVETKPKVSFNVRQLNDETEEIVASKISQFGKGFKIPDDRNKEKEKQKTTQ